MYAENNVKKLLESALQEQIATGCPGAILEISAPSLGFAFASAQGLYDRKGSRRLRIDDTFRAASVTKAFTATLAVYLAANHYWSLDDPIAAFCRRK